MKKIRILYFLLLLPMILFAQSREITGNVLDEDKNPLPGASILIQGTTQGVSTDFDGNFAIAVDVGATNLIISFIGYKDYKLVLTPAKNYKIQMEHEDNTLDEVIVVGYGSSTKRDLTGALTEVKETAEIAAQYSTVGGLLQGRTTGLQVSSNAGAPGAPTSIRIRGANSLRGNNEPLYVVDGVILNSAGEDVLDATSDANETQQTQNGLTGINPRDIESMVVLKDASATAIYGSRGANGVILITTKKGKQGKAVINVFGSSTISQITKKIDVLDAVPYAQYRNHTAISNENNVPYHIDGSNVYISDNGVPTGDPLRQINWQDEIYKTGYSNNGGFNVSGATEKSNYYMSFGLDQFDGVIPNTFLNSSTIQLNYSNDISDKFKVETRVGMYFSDGNMSQGASIGGGSRSFTRQLITYNPLLNGELEEDDPEVGESNPYSWLIGFEEKIKEKRINASIRFTYDITDHLKYQLRLGGNYRNKARSRWYGPETKKGIDTNGYLALSKLEKTSYTMDNLLIYNNRFNKHHRLNATLGVTYDGNDAVNTIYEVGQFPINNLREKSPQLGELTLTPHSSLGFKDNIFSYIGRFTYTLNDRYAFNASIRMDQSSKFREDNRTGYFPAASFAWTVSNENFLQNSDAISNLKFRASWGQVGNQAISPYQTFNNYGAVFYSDENNSSVLGVAPLNIANQDLTWETTTQINFGLDFDLFNNRITSSVDVYQKETTDLLINSPTPSSTGFQRFLINQGGLENKGVEFSLNTIIVDSEDFSFSLGGNISFNKSEIIDLSELPPSDIYIDGELTSVSYYLGNNVSTGTNFKSPSNAFIEGQPIGVFWGYQTNGIYKDQESADAGPSFQGSPNLAGDVIFVDLNGDGNINDIDKTVIGDPNPDFTYGINSNLTFRNFSLDILFTGTYGNEILNGNLLIENIADGQSSNIRPAAYFDSWTIENPNAAYPRIGSTTSATVPSDRLIEDGTYFRMSNVTLSYDLGFDKKSFVNSLKLYVSGNNLFTITDYSGYDPELTSFLYDGTIIGVDWVGTANISSFVVGVNLKF